MRLFSFLERSGPVRRSLSQASFGCSRRSPLSAHLQFSQRCARLPVDGQREWGTVVARAGTRHRFADQSVCHAVCKRPYQRHVAVGAGQSREMSPCCQTIQRRGFDRISLDASGSGTLLSENSKGNYNWGHPPARSFLPAHQLILWDPRSGASRGRPGDQVGQAVTVHLDQTVSGSGGPGLSGGTAPFSYSGTAVYKNQTISLLSGSFNSLDSLNSSTPRASGNNTLVVPIGDTFALTLSFTGVSNIGLLANSLRPGY